MDHSLTPYLLLTTALLALRHGWRDLQADRAIRRQLEERKVAVLKIGRPSFQREREGPQPSLFVTMTQREYEVRFRGEDGREQSMDFLADFHPVTGALRGIRRRGENGGDTPPTLAAG